MVIKTDTIDLYEDLGMIPIYNFSQCMKGNLKFMYESKKGEVNEDVKKAYDLLFEQWCKKTINNETLDFYNKIVKADYLTKRIDIVLMLLNVLLITPKEEQKEIYKALRKWDMNIYSENDIERCFKQLKSSKTKLYLIEEEIKEFNNKNNTSVNTNIQEQSIMIYEALGIKPDIYQDSVLHWLGYFDRINKISSKNGK